MEHCQILLTFVLNPKVSIIMVRAFCIAIAFLLNASVSYSQVLLERNGENYNYTEQVPDFIFIEDDNIPLYNREGKVKVIQDQRLDFLIKEYNSNMVYVGYRVQIYSGKDREVANSMREEFIKEHPDVAAHLIYQQPNFKLRLGDFPDRLAALRFFNSIKPEFPSAFVIKDEIVVNE